MYSYKVMIHPNNKQETKIRHILNKCIECNNIVYDYLDSFIKNNEKYLHVVMLENGLQYKKVF